MQKGSLCYSQVSPNKPLCIDNNQSFKCIWNEANTTTFYTELDLDLDFIQGGQGLLCNCQFRLFKLGAHIKLQWVVETGECVTDQLEVMVVP